MSEQLAIIPDRREMRARARRAKRIYETRLKALLEPQEDGKVVAIEVESEGNVLGNDELDATLKALEQFPEKIFYFIRVGSPVTYKMRSARRLCGCRRGYCLCHRCSDCDVACWP